MQGPVVQGPGFVQKPDGEGDTSCRSQAGHTRTSKGTEHRTCTHRHSVTAEDLTHRNSDNNAPENPGMPDQLPGRATPKFLYILPPLLMGMFPFPGRQSSAKPQHENKAWLTAKIPRVQ